MAKTWREIFKPEIDEWIGDAVNAAVNNNTRTIYFESVQDGEMRIDYAARKSGISVADFTDSMRNQGIKFHSASWRKTAHQNLCSPHSEKIPRQRVSSFNTPGHL